MGKKEEGMKREGKVFKISSQGLVIFLQGLQLSSKVRLRSKNGASLILLVLQQVSKMI